MILPGNTYRPLVQLYDEYQDQIVTFKFPSKTFNLAGLQFAYYYTTNLDYQQQMQSSVAYASNSDLPTLIEVYQQSAS